MDSSSFNTLFTGKFLIKLDEVDSTNNYLKEYISNNKPIEGTVILAEVQTAGRGQMGTTWQSQQGEDITLSVLYRPKFIEVSKQFALSAMASLAVHDLLTDLLPTRKIEVKWPNDILIDRKKVCGILIENSIRGSQLQHSIIGIGLNVGRMLFEGNYQATSMRLEGYEGGKEFVLKRLIEGLEKYYLTLKNKGNEFILNKYHDVLLGVNQELSFTDKDETYIGKVSKVNLDGQIEIQTACQRVKKYYHKEVKFNLFRSLTF